MIPNFSRDILTSEKQNGRQIPAIAIVRKELDSYLFNTLDLINMGLFGHLWNFIPTNTTKKYMQPIIYSIIISFDLRKFELHYIIFWLIKLFNIIYTLFFNIRTSLLDIVCVSKHCHFGSQSHFEFFKKHSKNLY